MKQDLNVLYQICVFRANRKKQDGRTGQSAKKVAHCTQVHDMWPFGPLVKNRDAPIEVYGISERISSLS